ncbi:tRNA-dihydrouridine synthase family protein [Candidatus Micrarchaeota archaeon]|nr:tRNA-dihydrouridine synthase family protein [Candidatus Micrarchaeota archaeon]
MLWGSFLAPIHDYSDLAFRLLCQKHGAESACVPLVNATAIARDPAKLAMVDAHPDERDLGVQLVGDSAEAIARAAGMIMDAKGFVSWLNINCGCPSIRTVESGGGSALLEKPEKIAEAVGAVKRATAKSDVPVSVKIRIKDGLEGTARICRMVEEAGADFIIIHGRTAEQGYSGKADWEMIKELKTRASVPVIGNGDVKDADAGNGFVDRGYCDGFMIGRAAMTNPMVFQDKRPGTAEERFALLDEYISLQERYLGKPDATAVKMKALNFTRGLPRAAAMRDRIARTKTVEEIIREA